MKKVWVISDTHLKHAKVQTYCQRPEGFTELTHKNIMQMVKPEDVLIHVGDVGIDKEEGPQGFMKLVREWPGKKWLVKGNHDDKSALWYVEHGFDFAADAILFRGIWITHKPADSLPPGANLNLHGHLHNVWDGFGKDDPEEGDSTFYSAFKEQKLKHPWQRLFALEYTDYKPVEFDRFIAKGHKLFQSTEPNQITKNKNILLRYPIPDATGNPFDFDHDLQELTNGNDVPSVQ